MKNETKDSCCSNSYVSKFYIVGLIIVWIIFSVVYIAGDIWTDFRNKTMNEVLTTGRQQGSEQAFLQIINLATNEQTKCNPIPLFQNNEIVVELVNIACLQQPTDTISDVAPDATTPTIPTTPIE